MNDKKIIKKNNINREKGAQKYGIIINQQTEETVKVTESINQNNLLKYVLI